MVDERSPERDLLAPNGVSLSDNVRSDHVTVSADHAWPLRALAPSALASPSHPGQLSLLPSAEWAMSTCQRAAKLCSWVVKAGMAHSALDKGAGGKQNCVNTRG